MRMRTVLRLSLLVVLTTSLWSQTLISTGKGFTGTGVLVITKEGVKIADVGTGFSYFSGTNKGAVLNSSFCSQNHLVSEEPTKDSEGRYVLRIRPNPASVAVYRGGIRLEPNVHYKLVYLQDGQLPDRFELLPAAPASGKVMVDYYIGTNSLM